MKRLRSDIAKNINGRLKTGGFDIVRETQELFSTFPYVLLIKDDKQARCFCFDQLTESFDTKCPACLGTGWVPTVEQHHCYWRTSGVPITLPRMIEANEFANTSTNARFFYMLPNAEPEKGDTIVITDFGQDGLPNFKMMEFYDVNYSDMRFDEYGRHVYYKVATEINPVDAKARTFNLFEMRNQIKIFPVY